MTELQAIAEHEGLEIIELNFTFSRGVRPSVCHVMAIPQPTFSGESGPLTLTYGEESVTFPDCAVDFADLRIEQGQAINMRILDRRWKWQRPIVTFRANLRQDESSIRLETLRTPAQLAAMLLGALGEQSFDTSEMPSATFPTVHWDGVKAVDALQELCDLCGCVVCLGLDNVVRIRRLGLGGDIPDFPVRMTELYPVPLTNLPSHVRVDMDDVLVQSKLALSATARDTNYDRKVLDALSYRPSNGWKYEHPAMFNNVSATYNDPNQQQQYAAGLAFEDVFRKYRVANQAHGGLGVPGIDDPITSMEQLTLRDTLNDYALDSYGARQALPAYVEGVYWPESDNYENTPNGTRYHGKFSIDPVLGEVHFDRPVWKLAEDFTHLPADLYLTTTYTVRRSPTHTPTRYGYQRQVNDVGSGTLHIERRDLKPTITQRDANVSSLGTRNTNLLFLNIVGDVQVGAVQPSLVRQGAQDARYIGWVATELDGTLAQITWTMGGSRGTNTRITRWLQHVPPGGFHVAH